MSFKKGYSMYKKLLLITAVVIFSISSASAYTVDNVENFLSATTERAQDDFYSYVNQKSFTSRRLYNGNIYYDYTSEIAYNNYLHIKDIINQSIRKGPKCDKSSTEYKVYALYSTFLDEKKRKETGIKPFQAIYDKVNACTTIQEYVETIAEFGREYGTSYLLPIYVYENLEDASKPAVYLDQSELVVAWRKGDASQFDKNIMELLKQVFLTAGYNKKEIEEKVKTYYKFTLMLLASKNTPSFTYSDKLTYKPYSFDQLCKVFSNVDFAKVIEKSGFSKENNVKEWSVVNIENAKAINDILVPENLETLKEFFIITNTYYYFKETSFKNYKALTIFENKNNGSTSIPEMIPSALNYIANNLNWRISKLWLERYFPKEIKPEVEKLCEEIKNTYIEMLDEQTWLSKETIEYAKNKVKAIRIEVAYPDDIDSYLETYELLSSKDGGSFLENVISIRKYYAKQKFEKLKETKYRWEHAPYNINATYQTLYNSIIIYAGYLQSPIFNLKYDRATNLGIMGTIIAHEISHSFDTNGSNYTIDGKRKSWWNANDYDAYKQRVQKIIDFYSNEEIVPGLKAKGEHYITEIIADLASLKCIARLCEDNKAELQTVFTSYAKKNYLLINRLFLYNLTESDPHPLGSFRVNPHMKNTDAFYKAFDVKPGDRLYVKDKDRVSLW
ncbi:MAG: M13 family metallopeptidase [Treponema sp.]|nr:M13 family metallopeptidase [Candidatus Treponema scatequi]